MMTESVSVCTDSNWKNNESLNIYGDPRRNIVGVIKVENRL